MTPQRVNPDGTSIRCGEMDLDVGTDVVKKNVA